MSLSLSLRAGHDFYVANTRFVVVHPAGHELTPFKFALRREDGRVFEICDFRWTFIKAGVRVQAGVPRNPGAKIVCIVFDAPREVRILRGELYRAHRRPSCGSCGGAGVLSQKLLHDACGGLGCSKCVSGLVVETFKCPDCEVSHESE